MKLYKYLIQLLVLVFFFSITGNVYSSAKDDFSKGVQFFKSGNYSAAIKHFKKSEQMGLKSASLYYNLGSSYYKAGQYKQSEIYFRKLSQYPKMHPLASFNLGLVSKKLGKEKAAEKYFQWVINNNSDKKLVALSRQQIRKPKASTSDKDWSSYASLAFGNDSNINAAPSGAAIEQSDSFITLYLNSEHRLKGTRSDGWFADAGLYHINYSEFNTNNETEYSLSVKRKLNISNWKTRFGTKITKSTYNDTSYQTKLMLEAIGTRKLSKENKLRFRYRYNNINSDNNLYDYLEGDKQQLRAELRRNLKHYKQRFYYEYEDNDRQDSATLSYSPTRHTLRGIHTIKLNNRTQWGGELSYRESDYPVVAITDRDSTRWKYGIFGNYRFDKTTKLKARFIHTNNDSDADPYDYDKNVISLTLSKIF